MKSLLFLLSLSSILLAKDISYTVQFEGLEDDNALRALRMYSQLVMLEGKPPASLSALHLRAEADLPELMKVLRAYGYFEAQLKERIEENGDEVVVILEISSGPLYRLESYHVEGAALTMEELGLCPDQPAISQAIIAAEERALYLLSQRGYPLAKLTKRDVIADGKTKKVRVELGIASGPFTTFGPTSIEGNSGVKQAFFEKKMAWQVGEVYNTALVEETQRALVDSGLFSSVTITHHPTIEEKNRLPMRIEVEESKHRSISIGASYQTTYGAGMTFAWENRNVAGMGRKLFIQADIAQRSHSGLATYLIPDAWTTGQDFLWQAQASYTTITAYRAQAYDIMGRLDWQCSPRLYVSAGLKGEYLDVEHSAQDGHFWLVEAPIHLRFSTVVNRLNPARGVTVIWKFTPSYNESASKGLYNWQMLTICSYWPFLSDECFILAQKVTLGTIWSDGLKAVPVPKRFLGGSEEDLRGYKYLTVSPLNSHDRPIGGRSAFYYSLEPRFKFRSVGFVPFLDIGNVWLKPWPSTKGKWRKSVGLGLRYFSFVGPFRLDIAFPLDRRDGIDPHWWVFISLGQTF